MKRKEKECLNVIISKKKRRICFEGFSPLEESCVLGKKYISFILNSVQGCSSGGGSSRQIVSPRDGMGEGEDAAHRAKGQSRKRLPYFLSPARGMPREANCTRI